MNCYDCKVQGNIEPAVATCANCGAGMCAAHTRAEDNTTTQAGIGKPVHTTNRKLVCLTCHHPPTYQGLAAAS